jgi:glycosyltransferase involved in cell wall biosynthesis
MNRISIITPCLNAAATLEATIQSIRAQNDPDLEWIIVDGGSTDGTIELISENLDCITKVVQLPGSSQSAAINHGAQMAKGTWISWLNADDILMKGALLTLKKTIAEHPEAGVVYGAAGKMDQHGNLIKPPVYYPYDQRRLKEVFYITQPACFFSRRLFLEMSGLNEGLEYAMDWDLLLKICPASPVIALPTELARLRIHANTKTAKGGVMRCREIASIGRTHAGWSSRNHLAFLLLSPLFSLSQMKGPAGSFFNKLGFWLSHQLDRQWGHLNYMVHFHSFESSIDAESPLEYRIYAGHLSPLEPHPCKNSHL